MWLNQWCRIKRTCLYIYIYVCVCVCVCIYNGVFRFRDFINNNTNTIEELYYIQAVEGGEKIFTFSVPFDAGKCKIGFYAANPDTLARTHASH